MAEIPRIKTPVQCGCPEGEYGGTVGIRDADGDPICCDAAAYINATEAGLAALSAWLWSDDWAASAITKMKELGLWREPQ